MIYDSTEDSRNYISRGDAGTQSWTRLVPRFGQCVPSCSSLRLRASARVLFGCGRWPAGPDVLYHQGKSCGTKPICPATPRGTRPEGRGTRGKCAKQSQFPADLREGQVACRKGVMVHRTCNRLRKNKANLRTGKQRMARITRMNEGKVNRSDSHHYLFKSCFPGQILISVTGLTLFLVAKNGSEPRRARRARRQNRKDGLKGLGELGPASWRRWGIHSFSVSSVISVVSKEEEVWLRPQAAPDIWRPVRLRSGQDFAVESLCLVSEATLGPLCPGGEDPCETKPISGYAGGTRPGGRGTCGVVQTNPIGTGAI